MPSQPAPPRRPARRTAACLVLVLAVAACGGSDDDGDASGPTTTAAPGSTTTAGPTTTGPIDGEADGPRTILDGWISYDGPAGWEVAVEAEGLLPQRAALGEAPTPPTIEALETLLELRHPEGLARVVLAREPAFLDAGDLDAWTEALAEEVAGDTSTLQADEPIDLSHGPGRRLRYQGADGETTTLATTAFDEQRLALVVEASPELDDEGRADLDGLVTSIELDPEVVLAPLLQFHAGLIRHEAAGTTVDLGIHVPSDWDAADVADGVGYSSADGSATAEVTFGATPDAPADETMAALLDERGRDDLLDGTERELDGTVFRVARFGPDELADTDLATSWLLYAEVGDVTVTIRLADPEADTADTDGGPETLLLRRMIDTVTVAAT